jgi:TRAP transporter TAXI family solute receptor
MLSDRKGKTGFAALGLALVIAASVGCGDREAVEDASAARRFVSIGTAPPGGAFFVVGGALAEVLDEHGGASWQVTAEATKGTMENLRRLARGEIDLALANSAITYFAVRGEAGWERVMPIRAVMTLAPNVALFVTPRASGIEAIGDLAGRRVVLGPAGAGFEYFLEPILEAHGLGYGDLQVLNATQAGAVDLLADSSAAAAFLGGAVPTASITQAATSQDLRFVPFDEAAVADLIERFAFFDRAVIPAGTYPGQEVDFSGMNVGSMHLVAAADTDEELVYEVAKVLWENRELVVEKHPAGRAINPRVAVRNTGTEFHPGAIRFYREIGIWPSEPSAAPGAD